MSLRYEFTGAIWRAPGPGGWRFITLPADMSARIRAIAGGMINAFGSLRVTARIGDVRWRTSLFMDAKRNAFLLPVKADTRRRAGLADGDEVNVAVEIDI